MFHGWKQRLGGLDVSEARRLKGAVGQWAGVHFVARDRLCPGLERRHGQHRTGQIDPERTCRELPRPTARRVPQHELVQSTER